MKKDKDTSLSWDDAKESELTAVCNDIEAIDERAKVLSGASQESAEAQYGDFLVLDIIPAGDRYDAKTGKQILFPTKQTFTIPEWNLFKNNYKFLGYTIVGIVSDPTGEAESYLEK